MTTRTSFSAMMKSTITLLVLAVAVVLAEETYDPKYDSFDAHQLVENKRLLKSYANCFLGKGPCTAEGSDFKRVIPEALATSCGKCTQKQKELVRVVVKGLQEQQPEIWSQLVKRDDPEGKYNEAFQKFLVGTD